MDLKQFSFILAFCICILSLTNCKNDKKTITQTQVHFTKEGELTLIKANNSKVHLDIEIADTDFDIQTGLMYRNTMKPNQGMLFVFEDESERFFYMKNTKIALDLIFIDGNNKIVNLKKNAKPFDETSLPSNAPSKYVLEVNAGSVNSWRLAVGDSISYQSISK